MLKFEHPAFEETTALEWLVTNGIGGYASGTLAGANTRRYHGLLVAALNPPAQRQVLVAKVEEQLSFHRDACVEFSSNQFPGTVHPKGYCYLSSFERRPLPRFVYEIGHAKVAKTVFMPHGTNATIVEYENIGNSVFQLGLTPLFVHRDYHSLFQEHDRYDFYCEEDHNLLKVYAHYGAAPLYVRYSKGQFSEARYWVKNLEYAKEAYRGLDFQEDAYAIGKIRATLAPREKLHLVFSLDPDLLEERPAHLKQTELQRLERLAFAEVAQGEFINDLSVAADQFIVWRASTQRYSILAGYHWFTDWGRDTMIAMRGLVIARGEKALSESIFNTFFGYLQDGLLPNRFPDFAEDEVEYNTIDATLWLFVALYEYYQKFGDKAYLEAHFAQLGHIIEQHLKGTHYNIHVTEEGFLYGGEGIAQLTWMDARVGGHVVTPRHGCPVEIQALWYNALQIYLFFAEELGRSPQEELQVRCQLLTSKLRDNFRVHFLNQAGYLHDVIIPGQSADDSLRPNQIYVISLPFSLLDATEERQVFEAVERHLYTPLGLRTLSPEHPDFKPVYGGDQWQRDTAYHQGTVWPFLLGDYFASLLKTKGDRPETRQEIMTALESLRSHFYKAGCIHGIAEIFDGQPPGEGRGTVQQAWSVGALLQVLSTFSPINPA